MSNTAIIHLGRWGLLAFGLAVWQWGWDLRGPLSTVKLGWLVPTVLDPYFVSKPTIIFNRFLELSCLTLPKSVWAWNDPGAFWACVNSPKGSMWTHTLATLRNTFWGFLVGVTSGVAVGLLLGRSETLAKIFEPYIVAFNSLPRVALVPLIIIMFGLGDVSKVVTALTLVFFNTFEGARSVDRDLINAARFLGASDAQVTWTVVVPSALAWVFASLSPAISFALIGVIVGEFIGSERGLGKVIIEAEAQLQIADMMVALVVLMVIGVSLVLAFRMIERRLLRWQRHHAEKLA